MQLKKSVGTFKVPKEKLDEEAGFAEWLHCGPFVGFNESLSYTIPM